MPITPELLTQLIKTHNARPKCEDQSCIQCQLIQAWESPEFDTNRLAMHFQANLMGQVFIKLLFASAFEMGMAYKEICQLEEMNALQ